MWVVLTILCLVAGIALYVARNRAEAGSLVKSSPATVLQSFLIAGIIGFGGMSVFDKVAFYADSPYIYHVRTFFGQEKCVDGAVDLGYNMHSFGRYTPWKRAMTVQATNDRIVDELDEGGGSTRSSANLAPMNIVFLDQVDADATASARFRLPIDCDAFLRMAREYRTPENLLNTALVPAFKETLEANASLMGADDYYSGARNKFNTEFSNQLENGLYIVERREVLQQQLSGRRNATASANASKGTDQDEFGDGKQTVFIVEKLLDDTGVPLRKKQAFVDFGVQVVESRITGMIPNVKFKERMDLKQQASADRAIAREQRIQEEQQKLLVEAKGQRQVAERQATWKADQIEQTTQAETRKQLALTEASKKLEQADIDREAAQILLEKAQIDAKAVIVAADAEAYQKEVILKADNALAQKLDAEIKIQGLWAAAFAKRQVPEIMMGASGEGSQSVGSNSEVKDFMSLMTVDAARNLRYNRTLGAPLETAK